MLQHGWNVTRCVTWCVARWMVCFLMCYSMYYLVCCRWRVTRCVTWCVAAWMAGWCVWNTGRSCWWRGMRTRRSRDSATLRYVPHHLRPRDNVPDTLAVTNAVQTMLMEWGMTRGVQVSVQVDVNHLYNTCTTCTIL